MPAADLPTDEDLRLNDLYSYHLLDTPGEAGFDELLELANGICDVQVALITLIDKERQWFKAKRVIGFSETPRAVSFCAHTILQDDVLMVEDMSIDSRFFDNPFVTGEFAVRFYAGAPIVSPQGHNLGSVCLIDTKPQKLSAHQQRQLKLIARQAATLIVLHKKNLETKKSHEVLLSRKSRSFHKLITGYQQRSSDLSYDLHENIAQTVSSCRFYLRLAQENHQNTSTFIETAITQLDKVVDDIRLVSYKMMPPGIKLMTIGETVKEMVSKMDPLLPFKLYLATYNSLEMVNSHTTTILLKLLYDWLQVLTVSKNAEDIFITLSLDTTILLQIRDSHTTFTQAERERELSQQAIYDQVQAFEGSVNCVYLDDQYILRIELPIVKDEAREVDTKKMPLLF